MEIHTLLIAHDICCNPGKNNSAENVIHFNPLFKNIHVEGALSIYKNLKNYMIYHVFYRIRET